MQYTLDLRVWRTAAALLLAFQVSFLAGCARENLGNELDRTTTVVESPSGPLAYERQADQMSLTYTTVEIPQRMGISETREISFAVSNTGTKKWPAATELPLKFSYHWYAPDPGAWRLVRWDDGKRVHLPADIAPGEETTLTLEVTAPAAAGEYQLVVSPLFEGTPEGNWATDISRQHIVTINVQ